MARLFVILVYILVLATAARADTLDDLMNQPIEEIKSLSSSSKNIESQLDNAYALYVYVVSRVVIMLGSLAMLVLIGSGIWCWRCCCREKKGFMNQQKLKPAITSNNNAD